MSEGQRPDLIDKIGGWLGLGRKPVEDQITITEALPLSPDELNISDVQEYVPATHPDAISSEAVEIINNARDQLEQFKPNDQKALQFAVNLRRTVNGLLSDVQLLCNYAADENLSVNMDANTLGSVAARYGLELYLWSMMDWSQNADGTAASGSHWVLALEKPEIGKQLHVYDPMAGERWLPGPQNAHDLSVHGYANHLAAQSYYYSYELPDSRQNGNFRSKVLSQQSDSCNCGPICLFQALMRASVIEGKMSQEQKDQVFNELNLRLPNEAEAQQMRAVG